MPAPSGRPGIGCPDDERARKVHLTFFGIDPGQSRLHWSINCFASSRGMIPWSKIR